MLLISKSARVLANHRTIVSICRRTIFTGPIKRCTSRVVFLGQTADASRCRTRFAMM
jgi:hypothetical protein